MLKIRYFSYTRPLVTIAELKTKSENRANSELWKKRNCAQKRLTETEFNTQNRYVTLNWKCKTELCAEIHSNGIIKNVNWSFLLDWIPKLRNKTWNWIAKRKTKRWMNLKKLKYNCNQQCINSIAAEFPTEIHCNFLSFSFNRKIVPIFRNWNLYANVVHNVPKPVIWIKIWEKKKYFGWLERQFSCWFWIQWFSELRD